jgi:NadR type nicotinamide-nucleotide adenylyltransferase
MQEVKKVVIIGPESTGKSTLCKSLALHYNTQWCPEYARQYLLQYGTGYTYADLLIIAKGQVALEEEYLVALRQTASGNNAPEPVLLFIDTNMYVMKVWCEFVFNNCHQYILDQIIERPADLYLLCNVDLPWTKDELREYPELETRDKLYHIYKDILINQAVPWIDVHGTNNERTSIAIEAVNRYFFTRGV